MLHLSRKPCGQTAERIVVKLGAVIDPTQTSIVLDGALTPFASPHQYQDQKSNYFTRSCFKNQDSKLYTRRDLN